MRALAPPIRVDENYSMKLQPNRRLNANFFITLDYSDERNCRQVILDDRQNHHPWLPKSYPCASICYYASVFQLITILRLNTGWSRFSSGLRPARPCDPYHYDHLTEGILPLNSSINALQINHIPQFDNNMGLNILLLPISCLPATHLTLLVHLLSSPALFLQFVCRYCCCHCAARNAFVTADILHSCFLQSSSSFTSLSYLPNLFAKAVVVELHSIENRAQLSRGGES
ncbi:hypothetical protein EGR_09785 [Echinococcus granulosus]|uniref:Uncharacterized protein n=1 Tax=Echinococcus granulosus TaxID=6210 RepID=W6U2P6_ECHGR|nr:hypothetical protein EGR_09785 [Echinococcus granulosus]EUB55348.1 hypothetical protein EGR_09785 [Echinococcus granulosus]